MRLILKNFLIFEFLAFVLPTILTLILGYLNISINSIQQIILLLIILIIFSFNLLLYIKTRRFNLLKWLFLCITTWLVQLIVISSGSFFSPFLILFHLYALGLSFLINARTTFIFLAFSITAIVLNTFFHPDQQALFESDFGSVILYFVSLITVAPISYLISKQYKLKESIAALVIRQLQAEESILQDIYELVIITDVNLNILAANLAFSRMLSFSESEIINKNFFDIILFKDKAGNLIDENTLQIKKIVSQKTTKIYDGLLLYTKNNATPYVVSIQIRPIDNLDGEVDQITFLISAKGRSQQNEANQSLDIAYAKEQAQIEELKRNLKANNSPHVLAQLDLIGKMERDLIHTIEIEDRRMKNSPQLVNMAQISQKAVALAGDFAKNLNTQLTFKLLNSVNQNTEVPRGSVNLEATAPYFTVFLDAEWVDILVHKLLDMSILLVVGSKAPSVELLLNNQGDSLSLKISFIQNRLTTEKSREELFKKNYGSLTYMTNLFLGSGLEGSLARSIANALNIPLYTTYDIQTKKLTFELIFTKDNTPQKTS